MIHIGRRCVYCMRVAQKLHASIRCNCCTLAAICSFCDAKDAWIARCLFGATKRTAPLCNEPLPSYLYSVSLVQAGQRQPHSAGIVALAVCICIVLQCEGVVQQVAAVALLPVRVVHLWYHTNTHMYIYCLT